MKNILIIEDDQIVANVYRNKLAVDGYKVEVAGDGESGLRIMRTFQPQIIILDLVLPTMSGVDVIKQIRSEPDFAKVPIIVFSNTYLTNLIQDAWRAGANKCLSKASCTPKDVIEVVRHTIGDSGAMPQKQPAISRSPTCPPRSRRCSRRFTRSQKTSTSPASAPSRRRWIFSACFLNGARCRKHRRFPPPKFSSWTTRPFPAAPLSMR